MRPRPPFSSSRPFRFAGCDKIQSKQEIKKGNEFLKAAQYQTALAAYEEALRLDPGETKLHKHIGIAYMGMYQPGSKHPKDLEYAQKAIDNLKQYVQAYPDDSKAREYLVSMYLNTERYDDAIAFYQNELLKRTRRTPRRCSRSRCCTSRRATSTTASSG